MRIHPAPPPSVAATPPAPFLAPMRVPARPADTLPPPPAALPPLHWPPHLFPDVPAKDRSHER